MDCVASIKNVIVNIDEPVNIRFLAFHTIGKLLCNEYKDEKAEKIFCKDINAKYVHFHFSINGYSSDNSEYLVAFLPRSKMYGELYQVATELCDIIEWIEFRRKVNCILFRYGHPIHSMDSPFRWQKQLEKIITETRNDYTIGRVEGKIKHVREDSCKSLTISAASLFDNINVS
jgi:hypothetical protein